MKIVEKVFKTSYSIYLCRTTVSFLGLLSEWRGTVLLEGFRVVPEADGLIPRRGNHRLGVEEFTGGLKHLC